jgi:NACHT domain/CHAT domain
MALTYVPDSSDEWTTKQFQITVIKSNKLKIETTSKLLILSSNPRRDLNLDRKISDLNNSLQRLGLFEIRLVLGVRAQELSELIAQHSPQIVHFCGHGAGEEGLIFQDEDGNEQLVSTVVLSQIFKTFSSEIKCVVLNANDSDQQGEAIVEHINYVISMSQPILDRAAHLFSVGFYQGLGSGKSIEQAYEIGCNAIQIWSETNSQSDRSRQYRKFEVVGQIGQSEPPPLPEYQNPVLLKKIPHSLQESPIPLVSPDRSQKFVDFARQEIDRKEYKDNAREAYDNFGHFSASNAAIMTKSEYAQRKILLGKVKQFWIEGFLQPSLQGLDAISFDMKAYPGVTADLTGIDALAVDLDSSYELLKTSPIYAEMGQGRTLLILGSPGAGKTIALLQLAQRLIERSERDLSLPIPIIFNLSSWARNRKSIVDWSIDELREKYQVSKSLSEPWMQQQQLILLLDGLDEVNEDRRNDCVRSLNHFIAYFPQTEMAICSQLRDYEALTERLEISSALLIQPLHSTR